MTEQTKEQTIQDDLRKAADEIDRLQKLVKDSTPFVVICCDEYKRTHELESYDKIHNEILWRLIEDDEVRERLGLVDPSVKESDD